MTKILITGTAGFIGFHLAKKLIENNYNVWGIDNINEYYDTNLKYARLAETGIFEHEIKNDSKKDNNFKEISFGIEITSSIYPNYKFIRADLKHKEALFNLFDSENFDYVIHLAAQAGVRFSIENPDEYIQSNIIGFFNILEACRRYPVRKLIYASSSSVYGNNKKIPFSVEDKTDEPVSLYAATKKSNELMAHAYSYLYNIPTIGLRFFTVYGPWGRPDMSPVLFAQAISSDKPIKVFNNGQMERDFTYINDIIEGIFLLLRSRKAIPNNYQIFNIGKGNPVNLLDFIHIIEKYMESKAELCFLPMQPGDVEKTWADTAILKKNYKYEPKTNIDTGIKEFVMWFKEYYK